MSDQVAVNNQARPSVAAPLILGAGGAVVGACVAPVKRGYRTYEDLLAMSQDTFENTVTVNQSKLSEEGKTAFEGLTEIRAEMDKINFDEIVKDQEELKNALHELGDEASTQFENAIKDAKEAVTNAADEAAKKTAQEALDKKSAETLRDVAAKTLTKEHATDAAKDYGHIKKILPKARFWWALGLGAAGLLIGRVIAKAAANKKNKA